MKEIKKWLDIPCHTHTHTRSTFRFERNSENGNATNIFIFYERKAIIKKLWRSTDVTNEIFTILPYVRFRSETIWHTKYRRFEILLSFWHLFWYCTTYIDTWNALIFCCCMVWFQVARINLMPQQNYVRKTFYNRYRTLNFKVVQMRCVQLRIVSFVEIWQMIFVRVVLYIDAISLHKETYTLINGPSMKRTVDSQVRLNCRCFVS